MSRLHLEKNGRTVFDWNDKNTLETKITVNIPAHSNGTRQMFLEDKIHGFKNTYISDENIVQQNEVIPQYRVAESSSVHHHKPMCYVKSHFTKNPRFTPQVHTKQSTQVYGLQNTGPQSTRITTSMAYDLQFELKSKQAGLTKSKPSIALSKAASYHKANHWS